MKSYRAAHSRISQHGFIVAENVVATSFLVLFAALSLMAITHINRFAAAARMQTMAQSAAQQRIDEILTVPWAKARPAVLAAGTQSEAALTLNDNTFARSGDGTRSAFSDLDLPVSCTRTTEITDITARQLRATVTVSYTFRGRTGSVQMTTLRACDRF